MLESPPDFLVVNLNAIDLDSDELTYTITNGNEMDYFKINASTGTVTVKNPPDREISEVYNLVVSADDGMQSVSQFLITMLYELSTTVLYKFIKYSLQVSTTLQVTLTDINDNAPKFVEDHYYTFIDENVPGGAPVLVVSYDSCLAVSYHFSQVYMQLDVVK